MEENFNFLRLLQKQNQIALDIFQEVEEERQFPRIGELQVDGKN